MSFIAIAVWLGLFFFWTSMLVRVHREFRRMSNERSPMNWTFYTLGIAGPLLLLGQGGKDPALSAWVKGIAGEPSEPEVLPGGDFVVTHGSASSQFALENDEPLRSVSDRTSGKEALTTVRVVLQDGLRERATDIHLEPQSGQLKVRCRVDGVLHSRGAYPPVLGNKIVSALKVLAGMDVAEKRRAQDGSFSAAFAGRPIDFRVSTVGTSQGEKMVIRVLDRRVGLRRLEQLGLGHSMHLQMHSIVTSPNGILVACGPTGSGKTTTLYAALQQVDRTSLNVITIEEPIEYRLPDVTQHNVNEKAGITFPSLLQSVLHQDPDILMVGEIRDEETAGIVAHAAMMGHFVYTTVHANDTVSAIVRLCNLGVAPYLIASSLGAILAQRLVRRLCKACRVQYKPSAETLKTLGMKAEQGRAFFAAKGCEACSDTGYRGRIGVFELLVLNDEIRSLMQQRSSVTDLRKAARRTGMLPLRHDALAKVVAGTTSLEEALRVTR